MAVEDVGHRIADIEHDHAQAAGGFVGAGALFVFALADATDGGEGAVDEADDLAEGDAVHRLAQEIPAVLAALGADEAGLAQLHENLVEEAFGEILPGHDFLRAEHGVPEFGGDAEVDKCAEGVFSSLGYFHEGGNLGPTPRSRQVPRGIASGGGAD